MKGIRYVHGNGFKKIEPCEVCGEGDIDLIDSHHIVPRIHNHGDSLLRKASEILYLCSNCHRKLHKTFGGMGSIPYTGPLAKYEIIDKVKIARKLKYEKRSIDAKTCRQIKEDYKNGLGSIRSLSRKYALNRSTLANVISGIYKPRVVPVELNDCVKVSKINIVQEHIEEPISTLPSNYTDIRNLYYNEGVNVDRLSIMYGMTGHEIRKILKIKLKIRETP